MVHFPPGLQLLPLLGPHPAFCKALDWRAASPSPCDLAGPALAERGSSSAAVLCRALGVAASKPAAAGLCEGPGCPA